MVGSLVQYGFLAANAKCLTKDESNNLTYVMWQQVAPAYDIGQAGDRNPAVTARNLKLLGMGRYNHDDSFTTEQIKSFACVDTL